MGKRTRLVLAFALVAAALMVPAQSSAAMPPDTWAQYVKVRARLITQVNTFIRVYHHTCVRQHAFLSEGWGKCVDPHLMREFIPSIVAMDSFLGKAYKFVHSPDPCFLAMLSYTTRNQTTRRWAIKVVHDAWAFHRPMAERIADNKRFILERNRSTNARLKVNRVCAP